MKDPSRLPLLILLGVVSLAALATAYLSHLARLEVVRQEKHDLLATVGELKLEQLRQWRKERLGDATVRAAESPYFRTSLRNLVQLPEAETEETRRGWRARMEIIREAYDYADVLLVDATENILLTVGKSPDPIDPLTSVALSIAFASGEAVLSDLFQSPGGRIHIDVIAPMFETDGSPLAAVIFRSDAEVSLFPLLRFWPAPTTTAETLLVRVEGDEVVLLNDTRFHPGSALAFRFPLTQVDLPAVQAALGRQGLFEGRDYRGVEVVADLLEAPDTNWILINKIDRAEVLAEVREQEKSLGAIVALFILLAAAAAAYIHRRRQAHVYRTLYRAERRERQAQEEFRTTLYSIGDAVITTDIEGRILRMNSVAENLTGWSEDEARGRPLEEVFRIISEEDRSTVQNPADRVLREGAVVGLANHTLLLARDGTERPIADSGAPIRDEEGQITGVVLVFSDQTREREAERSLRESEEFQRAMIDCSALALYSFDRDLNVLKWNRSAEEIFGWTEAEILGKPVPNVPENDRGAFRSLVQRLWAGESLHGVEVRRMRKDGSLVDVRVHAAPIRDDARNVVAVMGAVEDVTERKRIERAARESERLAQSTLDALTSNLAILDENGVIVAVNRTWREFARDNAPETPLLSLSEGANYLEVCDRAVGEDSETAAAMARGIRAVISGETKDFSLEYSCHSPTEKRWFYARVTRFIGEGPMRVVVNHENITARKQWEHRNDLQSAALNAAANAIVITDRQGCIEWVNPAFTKVSGYLPEEAIGKNPRDLVKSGVHDQAFLKDLWDTILAGKVWTGEMTNRRKDGTHYYEEAVITPVKNKQGEITHFVAVKLDVTDRKRLQAQFLQAQKMEAVGRLAGGVAHDFNNMLSVILGCTQMALSELLSDHPIREDLEEIGKAAERSASLTQQLLAFARQQTISPRILDLNDTVGSMLKMLGRLIGEDIDLLWKPGKSLWPVKMDPVQVDQILANLTVNARDAIDGVGKMTIETNNITFDEAYCRNHEGFHPGDYVFLGVSDNGAGMDRATLEQVFDPFFTTKPSGQGTGLGLATVYGIVKQNEGFINAYSEVGQGTSFRIYLPRTKEALTSEVENIDEGEIPKGSETILLVEDQEALVTLIGRMLEQLGYTVLSTQHPSEAIELAERRDGDIHLLMTDVIMPEMSGLEVFHRLSEVLPGLKCLYMSGYTADVIAHHGVLEEGIHFVQKPFSMESLARKIREVLDR